MPPFKTIALEIAAKLPPTRAEAQIVLGLVADLVDWSYSKEPRGAEIGPISPSDIANSSGSADASPV